MAVFVPEFVSTVEHSVQTAVPVLSLYESAGQMVHTPTRAAVPDRVPE